MTVWKTHNMLPWIQAHVVLVKDNMLPWIEAHDGLVKKTICYPGYKHMAVW